MKEREDLFIRIDEPLRGRQASLCAARNAIEAARTGHQLLLVRKARRDALLKLRSELEEFSQLLSQFEKDLPIRTTSEARELLGLPQAPAGPLPDAGSRTRSAQDVPLERLERALANIEARLKRI